MRHGPARKSLRAGDPVVIRRDRPSTGTFRRYDGRSGWVVSVNRERVPGGGTYTEIAVSFAARWSETLAIDGWFRPEEVHLALL